MIGAHFGHIAKSTSDVQRLGRVPLDACPRLCGLSSIAGSPGLRVQLSDGRLRGLDQAVADGLDSSNPSRIGSRLEIRLLGLC